MLKKRLDTCKSEYERSLSKVAQLHSQKVIPITKLYSTELERSIHKREYEEAVFNIEQHCFEVLQRVNIEILKHMLNWYKAYQKMLGFAYGYIDDVKEYLSNLIIWCKEEEAMLRAYQTDRESKRRTLALLKQEQLQQEFIETFNNPPLIQNICNAINLDVAPEDIKKLAVAMLKQHNIEPEGDWKDAEAAAVPDGFAY